MAKLQFLTILLVVTCFLGGVVSVTDKELEDRFNRMDQQLRELKEEYSILKRENDIQNVLIRQLIDTEKHCKHDHLLEGLQTADFELDSRVTALEENGGGGCNGQNETIAFTAALTTYDTILIESAVEFNEVVTNEGGGYDSTTGTFTVPPGGEGFYYFSAYFVVFYYEYAYFDIQINRETICTAYSERNSSDHRDSGHASCSAVAYAAEGDTVRVFYVSGTDETPVYESTSFYRNGFTGFRI